MISQVFARQKGDSSGTRLLHKVHTRLAYVQRERELCVKRRLREESKVCKVLESKVRKPKLAAKRELRENYPKRQRESGLLVDSPVTQTHTHKHTRTHSLHTQYRLHTTNTEVSPVPAEGGSWIKIGLTRQQQVSSACRPLS